MIKQVKVTDRNNQLEILILQDNIRFILNGQKVDVQKIPLVKWLVENTIKENDHNDSSVGE